MTTQENINTEIRTTLVDLLSNACIDLFADYDVAITNNEQFKDLHEVGVNLISLIGLSESYFRASLTICVTPDLLTASFPAPEEDIKEGDLQDWLGELANQLAGRFKNKVVPFGHKFELGIPTVIQGAHLKIDVPKCSNASKHQYITQQGGVVELNFSTLIDNQFIMNEPADGAETENLEEGEMLFF